MAFKIKKATRTNIFAKIALMGSSGSGKTYSALRLSRGMADEIEKQTGVRPRILMGNTEKHRGYYYANEFDYDIVDINAPHTPEKYVEFFEFAEAEGYQILILDSGTHEWRGKGGILDIVSKNFNNWKDATPRHDKFVEALTNSNMHVIMTTRSKDQYSVGTDDRGKSKVEKLGVGTTTREDFEYEFTCTFLIAKGTNSAESQKDNTHIFENDGSAVLSERHGERIIQWANSAEGYVAPKQRSLADIVSENKLDDVDLSAQLDDLKKKIGDTFKIKMKSYDKNLLYAIIEDVTGDKNPNKISDVPTAEEVLDALENFNG